MREILVITIKRGWERGAVGDALMASAVHWEHPKCFLFASDTAPDIFGELGMDLR
jgi:hypothetical protein